MNYMRKVAKMLGVELNEKFKIKYDGTYALTNDGLVKFDENGDSRADYHHLVFLLTDVEEIEKPNTITSNEKRNLFHLMEVFGELISLKKRKYQDDQEVVEIKFPLTDGHVWYVGLPPFPKGSRFTGLKLDKDYKYEELGL